jgi:hypothetical protein
MYIHLGIFSWTIIGCTSVHPCPHAASAPAGRRRRSETERKLRTEKGIGLGARSTGACVRRAPVRIGISLYLTLTRDGPNTIFLRLTLTRPPLPWPVGDRAVCMSSTCMWWPAEQRRASSGHAVTGYLRNCPSRWRPLPRLSLSGKKVMLGLTLD